MTNSSNYEPTDHHATIVNATHVFNHVNEVERAKERAARQPRIEENSEEAESRDEQPSHDRNRAMRNIKKSDTPKKVTKEIGTDYDPPARSSVNDKSSIEVASDNPTMHVQDQAMQTDPKKTNKKMQVSMHTDNDPLKQHGLTKSSVLTHSTTPGVVNNPDFNEVFSSNQLP